MSGLAPILLTAGGTGGHMFPAEALAAALLKRGRRVMLVTDKRGQGFGDRLPEVETRRIPAGALAGKRISDRLSGLFRLAQGYFEARRILRSARPSLAVGFGGYASVPAMLAAAHAKVPLLLHEQNAVMGRANRLLASRANRIATCFEQVGALPASAQARAVLTGNPVRPAIAALAHSIYVAPQPGGALELLVIGGSQGARILSQVIPAAIERLGAGDRARLRLAQQCRAEDLETVAAAYRRIGFAAELKPFFADMAARLAHVHLMIARSGASTVAELQAAGRPSILVPYRFAADDHQTANARAMATSGAAWVMTEAEFTPEALAARLASLLADPQQLATAAAASRSLSHPDAAERLADLAESLAPLAAGKEAA
ncbi:UDP-N-acetylglucosamine--N-acetylmuramyl-(pentapeptide) pyrophosphoryl-undecaprenol N-acetylglucosamine transferase [Hypericibacter terrae]|uniref:UDP-N-acetylglucosamine--N-acetylmuramyl-(pentapeptide) pyrophosphoryl-undecaprenol N-acetylglucosamine transferase n=1 Tax=Hypericibacter terrae TaxID=2602015 RepID=A0A5J6MEG0_9PROT|nr:undecaprenyldiphospho-muramoylpentapeptide beta-N-acetylglucosaminyltransferase [Hypericibacter terrae]QEX15838.1 UDP-N-acetylglucosamine--N-acetylmuramyl-(pentapeptide) pyrophosphoryl-undecaprenol N-acetylglucosamine transferase [Hypericibacter terrae]